MTEAGRSLKMIIAEDAPIIRAGILNELRSIETVEISGICEQRLDVLDLVELHGPDLVIMNLDWPDRRDAIRACIRIRKSFESTKVLVYSGGDDEQLPLLALLAGASGYLSRNSMTSAGIQDAVAAIRGGGMYFDWSAVERLAARMVENDDAGKDYGDVVPGLLTKRELDILRLVGEGYSNSEIAVRLNIAKTTVRNYIIDIRAKMGLESRYKLISYAARRGILSE